MLFPAFSLPRIFVLKNLFHRGISLKAFVLIGSLVIFLSTIVLGALRYVQDSGVFLAISIVVRILCGLAITLVNIGTWLSILFSEKTKFILALTTIDLSTSITYIIVTPIAGVLCQTTDVAVPFFTFGTIGLVVVIAGIFIMERFESENIFNWFTWFQDHEPNKLFKKYSSIMAIILLGFNEVSVGYFSVVLSTTILSMQQETFVTVGGLFSGMKLAYCVGMIFTGKLLKQMDAMTASVSFGLILKCFGYLLLTSPHVLPNKLKMAQLSTVTVFIGLSDGILRSSSYIMLRNNAIIQNKGITMQSYEMITYAYNLASQIGIAIGAIAAGILDVAVGFPHGALIMMILHGIMTLITPAFMMEGSILAQTVEENKKRSRSILSRDRPEIKGVYKRGYSVSSNASIESHGSSFIDVLYEKSWEDAVAAPGRSVTSRTDETTTPRTDITENSYKNLGKP